jgi:glycosyltransferase involved in cell wall biosynthesis
MRIAHINNMANVAWNLAEAQRRLGHGATVFSIYDFPSVFPHDVGVPGTRGPLFWNVAMARRIFTFQKFDVLHVHGGMRLTQVFYPLFKRLFPEKVLAVHFHGVDARSGLGLHHLPRADVQFRSTQDLASFVPNSEWLPSPIDLPDVVPTTNNRIPRFGHFPFRWRPGAPEGVVQKGTDRIVEVFRQAFGAVESKSEDGNHTFAAKEAELVIVSGRPHEEAMSRMAACDIVVDQISDLRIYGMAALEGMALGKPVMSNYNPEWFPGTPVVRIEASPVDKFREIARDPGLRRELGRRGRAFIAEVHEAGKIARRTIDAYHMAIERHGAVRSRAKDRGEG